MPFESAKSSSDKFSQCDKNTDGSFATCIKIDSSNVRNINFGVYSFRVKTWTPLDAHTAVTDPGYILYQTVDLTVKYNCGLETITAVPISGLAY